MPAAKPLENGKGDGRQAPSNQLSAELSNGDFRESNLARQWFVNQGYFADAVSDLRWGNSPERAAAARTLGLIGSDLASAALIASLFDPESEVRLAAVEALNRIADPAVNLDSLNALFKADQDEPNAGSELDTVHSSEVGTHDQGQALVHVDPALRGLPQSLVADLSSPDSHRRARALEGVGRTGAKERLCLIGRFFDDPSPHVRKAAALAVNELEPARSAEFFSEAFRSASSERSLKIASAMAASGVASAAIKDLRAGSRQRAYNALCLLALMAEHGETKPLVKVIEEESSIRVRSAAVKLLTITGQPEIARVAVKRRLKI